MKILITGGTGMVGTAFKNTNSRHELILVNSKEYDLKETLEANRMIKEIKPQAVIHLAARVGGIRVTWIIWRTFFLIMWLLI